MYEDSFDEYGDLDAISCASGDYNAFEERECFLDECQEREDFFHTGDWDDDGIWDELPDSDDYYDRYDL